MITYRIYEGTFPSILLSDLDLLRNVLIKDSNVFINRRVEHRNVFSLPLFNIIIFRDRLSRVYQVLSTTDSHC